MFPASLIVLAVILLVVGAGLFFLVSFLMARVLLMPERMEGGRAMLALQRLTPKDLDLPYEETFFTVRDEWAARRGRAGATLAVAAWWIPAAHNAGKCAVIVHGYSDSKIGGIAWAPTFRALGYNVLAIDLRAHGRSDGTYSTAGYWERHDVSQVIDQLRQLQPAATRQLVLFGVSLGAATVCATAELRQCRDVAAVIMDCPYSDYPSAAMTHGDALGMPGTYFQRLGIRIAERLSGARFLEVAPTALIPRVACPLMVIHGADDLFITAHDMDSVEAATRSRPAELGHTDYWRPDKTHHVLALRTDPGEFRRRVGEFLEAALRSPLPDAPERAARVEASSRLGEG
ncbi:MAG TPA: alpha/beta hydrolase [Tepidisphaeraceae bacterium]|nr:alpha/beta hydrolase [Tepidisphaeraceae bacterium]